LVRSAGVISCHSRMLTLLSGGLPACWAAGDGSVGTSTCGVPFHSLARSSGVMSCHSWRERPLPGGGWACCWLLGGSVRRSGFFGGVQAAIRSSGDMSRHSLGRMSRSGGRCVVMYCVVGGVFSCTVGGCGGMYGCGWICCCTEGGSAFHASDGMPAGGAEVVECAAGVDEGLVDGCVTGGVAAAGSVGCA